MTIYRHYLPPVTNLIPAPAYIISTIFPHPSLSFSSQHHSLHRLASLYLRLRASLLSSPLNSLTSTYATYPSTITVLTFSSLLPKLPVPSATAESVLSLVAASLPPVISSGLP
jgi:hypothetical protein